MSFNPLLAAVFIIAMVVGAGAVVTGVVKHYVESADEMQEVNFEVKDEGKPSSFLTTVKEDAQARGCSNNIKSMYETCLRGCPAKWGRYTDLECPTMCAETIIK